MKPRMNYYQAAPETIKALVAVEAQIQASGLEKSLIELVKTRASQINGCAYCITCTRRTPASRARPSSGSTCSTPGASRRSIPSANAPRWRGPKR